MCPLCLSQSQHPKTRPSSWLGFSPCPRISPWPASATPCVLNPTRALARLASPLWHPQREALFGCTPPAADPPPGPTGTQVSQSLLARARCYALLGQRKTALLDFNAALRAEPGSVAALCGRGILHLGLGQQQVWPWGHRCLQTK